MKKILSMIVVTILSFGYTFAVSKNDGSYFDYLFLKHELKQDCNLTSVITEDTNKTLKEIDQNSLQFTLVRAEILDAYQKNKKDSNIEILGVLREECMYIITSFDSNIENITDLKKDSVRIGVGVENNSLETFKYIQRIEKSYDKPVKVFFNGIQNLKEINKSVDVMFLMSSPDRKHEIFKNLNVNHHRIINATDKNIVKHFCNDLVYESNKSIDKDDEMFVMRIKTICSKYLLVANKTLPEDLKDRFTDVINKKYKH